MIKKTCSACAGYRINAKARSATIAGRHIGELASLPATYLRGFLKSLKHLRTTQGRALVAAICRQLDQFDLLGIPYLHLNRNLPTLSGSELQRVSLVSHLEAGLDSVIYIFDEPTMGMHELEKNNLKAIFKRLKDSGSTTRERTSTTCSNSQSTRPSICLPVRRTSRGCFASFKRPAWDT